jgi:NAD(P)-dependent dehydrogenase (short-subunit alcohol dehydrogenase family)
MTTTSQFSFDRTEFDGKRALITGGTKGMGEATVRRLAAGGATVATTARSPLPETRRPTFSSKPTSAPRRVSRK